MSVDFKEEGGGEGSLNVTVPPWSRFWAAGTAPLSLVDRPSNSSRSFLKKDMVWVCRAVCRGQDGCEQDWAGGYDHRLVNCLEK